MSLDAYPHILDPGAPGRPLVPIGKHFWKVPPGYPQVEQAEQAE